MQGEQISKTSGNNSAFPSQGDSGGPLYISKVQNGKITLDGTEPYYLVGVVSFGSRNCGTGKPTIYTRVESFLPWIKENIKK